MAADDVLVLEAQPVGAATASKAKIALQENARN